ncbi:chemotaxis response regulator protein-glutamate methylesterase [Microseira sp. BLCC-F43]|jgi:two-component system chemotaxis response regulator CheB|uniref:protein-glutamate methylesterase/protein-glutamine glutaminase n=1 Tax=Microseira sp. BLCC-F43 TaxID=3153602 RepID=UPI0035B886C8
MAKIRVLIVDDSSVVRPMVSNALAIDPALEVVGTAANGQIAIAKIPLLNLDLIILDVAMPEMDGLETLAAIREQDKNLPIIMYSALTELGAIATLEALSLGATDYVTKPHNMKTKEAALEHIQQQLIPKIKIFSNGAARKQEDAGTRGRGDAERGRRVWEETAENGDVKKIFHSCFPSKILSPPNPPRTKAQHPLASPFSRGTGGGSLGESAKSKIDIVAIGVSTGEPTALETILRELPANFPVPLVIVQHMPPVFTKPLAERLAQKSKIRVSEGVQGGILEPGHAWIAPGDFHMVVEKYGSCAQICINQDPPENSCRPAVDVLFRSVAKSYGANTLAVVLTGMGQDGLIGCQYIKEAGAQVIVQDEKTSVVWGMPGIVANSGLAEKVLPLDEIAGEIICRCNCRLG